MILGCLWFGKNSPDMSAFLNPLSEELKNMENGVMKRTLSDGKVVMCPVYSVLCVCDSVAKPKVENIVQFNGYFGCGYCEHPGKLLANAKQIRYPIRYRGHHYPLRTLQAVSNAMIIAEATGLPEIGVKGHSPLLRFPTIHLVFGVPIDYLHCFLLGVVKRLVSLWFDESSTQRRYYIKKFERQVDSRLENIIPPSKIATRPKIISKRSQWKGKDWGYFLLHFGIPCLE